MALRLPWSDRFAASWRRWNPAPVAANLSRTSAEFAPKSDEVLRLGGAEADLATNCVRAPDGTVTTLRRQSAQMLRTLAARRGRNVSKEHLSREVWGGVAVTDDSLVQCVGEIRRALGTGRGALVTVEREGYRLEAAAEPSSAQPNAGVAAPRSWLPAFAMALLVVLTGAALAWRGATTAPPLAEAAAFDGPVVAVLPVRNLAGGERWDLLARGLTEDITADLAQNAWLYVLAGATTGGHAEVTAQEIAAALGVDHVVTAGLRAEGGRVSLVASLVQAETGRQVWSRRWEGAEGDLLGFQRRAAEELTGELASTWSGALAGSARARARGRAATDLTAYELAQLGVEGWNPADPQAVETSLARLEEAVARDPAFGDAWAWLAYAYLYRIWPDTPPEEAERAWAQSDAAGLEAFRVSPDLPKPLISAAYVFERRGDDATAQRMIRRAVAVAPNNADMLAYAANRALHQPDLAPEMLAWVERAMRLNPEHPDWYEFSLGATLFALGRYDEAAEAFLGLPDFVDNHALAAAALALAGRTEEAGASFARAAATPGFTTDWVLDAQDSAPEMRSRLEEGLTAPNKTGV